MWLIFPLLNSFCILSVIAAICSSNPKGIIKVSQSFLGISHASDRAGRALAPTAPFIMCCVQSRPRGPGGFSWTRGSGKEESLLPPAGGHPSIHIAAPGWGPGPLAVGQGIAVAWLHQLGCQPLSTHTHCTW